MKIYAIAVNTFKEVIRDKIFYTLLFFATMLVGASVLLSALSFSERTKILADLALGSISIFGVIIAIFVGIGLVDKEIQKKTVYTIISKPIRRYEFLLGKYLGLCLTLLVYVAVMSVLFLAVLFLYSGLLRFDLLEAVLLIYVELLVVTATAMFFSTFSTPTLSAAYALAIFVIGHLTGDLVGLADKADSAALKALLKALYYILPNLENFNIRAEVVHGDLASLGYIVAALSYGFMYVIVLLSFSVLVFQKRDFK
jgi:ABC-type transport system involved in multi-copper enzyme maturation permease subunit